MPARRAVFLDRDGVVNDPAWDEADGRHESPHRPQDVVLAEGAVDGLRDLREAGYVLVVASNQPSAAKGKVTIADLHAVHDRVAALLAEHAVVIDDWRYCFHHPAGTVPELTADCPCRKPRPGMLLDAAADHGLELPRCWMVGDSDSDVGAAAAAGCRAVLVEHALSAHRRAGSQAAVPVVRNLRDAAALIRKAGEAESRPGR